MQQPFINIISPPSPPASDESLDYHDLLLKYSALQASFEAVVSENARLKSLLDSSGISWQDSSPLPPLHILSPSHKSNAPAPHSFNQAHTMSQPLPRLATHTHSHSANHSPKSGPPSPPCESSPSPSVSHLPCVSSASYPAPGKKALSPSFPSTLPVLHTQHTLDRIATEPVTTPPQALVSPRRGRLVVCESHDGGWLTPNSHKEALLAHTTHHISTSRSLSPLEALPCARPKLPPLKSSVSSPSATPPRRPSLQICDPHSGSNSPTQARHHQPHLPDTPSPKYMHRASATHVNSLSFNAVLAPSISTTNLHLTPASTPSATAASLMCEAPSIELSSQYAQLQTSLEDVGQQDKSTHSNKYDPVSDQHEAALNCDEHEPEHDVSDNGRTSPPSCSSPPPMYPAAAAAAAVVALGSILIADDHHALSKPTRPTRGRTTTLVEQLRHEHSRSRSNSFTREQEHHHAPQPACEEGINQHILPLRSSNKRLGLGNSSGNVVKAPSTVLSALTKSSAANFLRASYSTSSTSPSLSTRSTLSSTSFPSSPCSSFDQFNFDALSSTDANTGSASPSQSSTPRLRIKKGYEINTANLTSSAYPPDAHVSTGEESDLLSSTPALLNAQFKLGVFQPSSRSPIVANLRLTPLPQDAGEDKLTNA